MISRIFRKFVFLSLVASALASFGMAECVIAKIEDGKAYIQPGNIFIVKNKIFLHIDENLCPISGVHSDAQGIYINETEAMQCYSGWKCPECGAQNGIRDSHCWRCGH